MEIDYEFVEKDYTPRPPSSNHNEKTKKPQVIKHRVQHSESYQMYENPVDKLTLEHDEIPIEVGEGAAGAKLPIEHVIHVPILHDSKVKEEMKHETVASMTSKVQDTAMPTPFKDMPSSMKDVKETANQTMQAILPVTDNIERTAQTISSGLLFIPVHNPLPLLTLGFLVYGLIVDNKVRKKRRKLRVYVGDASSEISKAQLELSDEEQPIVAEEKSKERIRQLYKLRKHVHNQSEFFRLAPMLLLLQWAVHWMMMSSHYASDSMSAIVIQWIVASIIVVAQYVTRV